MEVLATTASIIAAVQIAQAVGVALKDYYQGVRDARGDIKELYSAVKSLEVVLMDLESLVKSRSIDVAVLQSANGALQLCKTDLMNLEALLKFPEAFKGKTGRFVRLLKWPMKKENAIKMTRTIERHKTTLTLDVGVRNLSSNIEQFDILKDIQRTIAAAGDTDERNRIARWLNAADPSKEHNAARDKHEATTGSWLIRGDEFQNWLGSENSLLWLTAGAGAGKSILCSTAIDAVQELSRSEVTYAVAYWYFTFTDKEKQDVSNFLGSIIVQLLSHRTDTPDVLLDAYEKSVFGSQRPSLASLQVMLKAVVEGFENVFIFVDALDECPSLDGSRRQLLDALQQILGWNINALHLFLTSRKETDIETAVLKTTEFMQNCQFIAPEGNQVQADVRLFLLSRLKSPQFSRWPPKLKVEAEAVLSERAQGMFRLVALQLDELGRMARLSPKSIQVALNQLPRTLDSFYDRMLLCIDELHSEQALIALQWLAFSARPLKLRELAEAMIIHPADNDAFDPEDRFMDDSAVLDILPAGLVSVLTVNEEAIPGPESDSIPTLDHRLDDPPSRDNVSIQFAHFSVKEYLCSTRIASSPAACYRLDELVAHNTVAAACVTYVSHLVHKTEPTQINEDPDVGSVNTLQTYEMSVVDDFGLFHYAFLEWPYHVARLDRDASSLATNAVLRLLSKETISSYSWQVLMTEYGAQVARFRWPKWTFGETDMEQNLLALEAESPIAYALWLGLPQLARNIIDYNQTWDAAWTTHDLGAEIPIRCLMRAAQTGWVPVAQLLLDNGVPVDAELRESPLRHALHFAVAYQQAGMVKFLLDAGADINAHFSDGSALRYAAMHRSLQFTELLLAAGADPNVGDGEALYFAAVTSQRDVAQILIEAGANVNVNNDKPTHRGPLYYAATQGSTAMVRFLLEAGADIQSQHKEQLRISEILREKSSYHAVMFHIMIAGLWEIIDWQKSHGLEVPEEVETLFGGQFWEKWGSGDATQKEAFLKDVGLYVWHPNRPSYS